MTWRIRCECCGSSHLAGNVRQYERLDANLRVAAVSRLCGDCVRANPGWFPKHVDRSAQRVRGAA